MYALMTISCLIRKLKNQQYMGDHKYMEKQSREHPIPVFH
jgi:hypothetical protein